MTTELVLDRTNGVVHRKACPTLLTATVQLESYVGLERALGNGLQLCPCVQIVVMRATSDFLRRASRELRISSARSIADSLGRLVQAFEDGLSTSGVVGPSETKN